MPAPRRRADVTAQQVGRETVLHDNRLGLAHVVNGSAAAIWELCDGETSVEQIVARLAGRYAVSHADLQRDVSGALTTFRSLQLIE